MDVKQPFKVAGVLLLGASLTPRALAKAMKPEAYDTACGEARQYLSALLPPRPEISVRAFAQPEPEHDVHAPSASGNSSRRPFDNEAWSPAPSFRSWQWDASMNAAAQKMIRLGDGQ